MQKFLYGDNSIDFQRMLCDLDMANYEYEYVEIRQTAFALQTENDDNKLCKIINKYNRILITCDKLAVCSTSITRTINNILHIMTTIRKSKIKHPVMIINHTLSSIDLLKLYKCTNAYNLVHGYVAYIHHDKHDTQTCHDATLNGLRITDITIWNKNISTDDIRYYTSLTNLNIYCNMDTIWTYIPFAKSLKILVMRRYGPMDGSVLSQCCAIEKLYVCHNTKITTCEPFAKSLKVLNADSDCGIDDKGLELCTSIVELYAGSNHKITTCAPFAKSLKKLRAISCGIGDTGLKTCDHIEYLDASCNSKITTCAPFAKSLKKLSAVGSCGIGDIGLKTCRHIEYLNASHNSKITTCVPFSQTLMYLIANGEKCGITTAGIRSCKLISLTSSYNHKIDRSQIIVATNND